MSDVTEPPPLPPPMLQGEQLQQLIEQGYLQVELKPALLQSLEQLAEAASSFLALPRAEKRKAYPQAHGTELGYYNVDGEKQYVTLRHSYATSDDGRGNDALEACAADVWQKTSLMMLRILSDISAMLSIDFSAWDPVLDGCTELPSSKDEMTPTLLRTFEYLPSTGIAEQHRDLGLLTLCVGSGEGLQVWHDHPEGGQWVDTPGPTILTGRTLRYLSSGRVNDGLHRVVGNPKGRNSLVFALRPSTRGSIPLTPFGGWGTVPGDEFWAHIKSTAWNINARKDIRERQRSDRERIGHMMKDGQG